MFSIRGLTLHFPALEPWVAQSAWLPAICPVYLRKCGAAGSASGQTACHVSPTLHQSQSPVSVLPRQCESSLPRLPISAPPTGLDECLFFISLVSDLLAVRYSVSSGCERRRSVSTYAAILVLESDFYFYSLFFSVPIGIQYYIQH